MTKKLSVVIPSNNNKNILQTISSVKEIADEPDYDGALNCLT